ncbi:MAG TPA: winged helix DNA-binding protein [Allosphingosinicella sp.]|jgi:DNA-binding MarR family transcriptional regulator
MIRFGLNLDPPLAETHDSGMESETPIQLDTIRPDKLLELSVMLRRLAERLAQQDIDRERVRAISVSAATVRHLIALRRLRGEYLPTQLFADPAWDMLLDLYVAQLEGRRVSVSSLCVASQVPATTALRWIKVLEERQLIVRHADPEDGRRVFLMITDDTADKIARFMLTVQARGCLTV